MSKEERFTYVDDSIHHLLWDDKIDLYEFVFLIKICKWRKSKGYQASNKYIQDDLGMSRNTVRRIIRSLLDKGLISEVYNIAPHFHLPTYNLTDKFKTYKSSRWVK